MIRPLVERGIEPRMTLVQPDSGASVAASDAAQAAAAIARAQAGTDLTAAQAEMAARRRSVPILADKVRRAILVAPVDGHVNRVLVSTIGASIPAGAPIAEVVPSADTLTVEAAVSPKDIASVRIGQRAKINVSAYESAIYGSLEGRVVTISPDAAIDEKTGESHYTVRVRGDVEAFRDGSGRRLPIGPGMTADVNLLGDRRSVMAYLFTPIARLGETALRE